MSDRPPSFPLDDLLRRLAQGDSGARAELIERSQERLRGRIRQMLPSFPGVRRHEHTSDVLQQVLLELSDTLGKVNPVDARHFFGLAGMQIRRTLLDLAQKYAGSRAKVVHNDVPGSDATLPFDPAAGTDDAESLAQWTEIHEYIHALPEDERQLFDLLFYQNLPQEAAAQVLNTSYRTLKRRWQAARLRFMEKFGAGGFP